MAVLVTIPTAPELNFLRRVRRGRRRLCGIREY
jgi:hypothetical protein